MPSLRKTPRGHTPAHLFSTQLGEYKLQGLFWMVFLVHIRAPKYTEYSIFIKNGQGIEKNPQWGLMGFIFGYRRCHIRDQHVKIPLRPDFHYNRTKFEKRDKGRFIFWIWMHVRSTYIDSDYCVRNSYLHMSGQCMHVADCVLSLFSVC